MSNDLFFAYLSHFLAYRIGYYTGCSVDEYGNFDVCIWLTYPTDLIDILYWHFLIYSVKTHTATP